LIFQSLKADKTIEEKEIRKMLGLVDKSKLIHLLKHVFQGDEKSALKQFKEIFEEGLDAKIFLNDILELIYLFSRRINLGPIEKDLFISEGELELIEATSKNLNTQDLGLFWQLTIKTIEDLRTVSSEKVALEMYLIQLMHVKGLDEQEVIKNFPSSLGNDPIAHKKKIDENNKDSNLASPAKDQLKSVEQIKVFKDKNLESDLNHKNKFEVRSFSDLVTMAERDKDMELKYDLERNVKLVKFGHGKIDINFNENLNKNFIKKLSQSLFKWTNTRWIITLSKEEGQKTLHEKKIETKKNVLEREKQDSLYKEILNIFPDADLTDVKEDHE